MVLTPIEQKLDQALASNLVALKEALFDLLAGLILVLAAVVSVLHSLFRVLFAFVGLALWVLALVTIGLYALRAWAVARSGSSIHRGI